MKLKWIFCLLVLLASGPLVAQVPEEANVKIEPSNAGGYIIKTPNSPDTEELERLKNNQSPLSSSRNYVIKKHLASRENPAAGGEAETREQAPVNNPMDLVVNQETSDGQIDTMAGIPGKPGYSGDGSDASKAYIGTPMGITVDRQSNIYFSDSKFHVIRRIDAVTGRIDTVAGTGKRGFSNDGGNALLAPLNNPTGITADSRGNIYIADTGNQRIRMLTANGYLYTIAGNGRKGYNGNGLRPLNSSLNNPTGIALSPWGEIYISDTENHLVRKIHSHTGTLVNVAGTNLPGSGGDYEAALNASLNRPTSLTFDKKGNLFIADTGNHRVRWIEPIKNFIFTIAGTGRPGFSGEGNRKSTESMLRSPTGLAVDGRGRLYISDTDNNRIRRLSVQSRMDSKIDTLVGNGANGYNGSGMDAWDASLSFPGALFITPQDMLFFVDPGNNLIRRVQAISEQDAPVRYQGFGQENTVAEERSFWNALFGGRKK